MMNHDLVLSEREKKKLAQLPVDFFSLQKYFMQGKLLRMNQMFLPTLSLLYK